MTELEIQQSVTSLKIKKKKLRKVKRQLEQVLVSQWHIFKNKDLITSKTINFHQSHCCKYKTLET